MSRISALRAFALAAFAGAAFTATASANPLVLGYAPQDTRSVETMTEPDAGFQQVARFKRQMVSYYTTEAPGTIIIDTPNTYLYLVLGNGRAMRYGIGVGREGFTWSGTQTITRKAEWPDWHPPQEMIERQPYLPRFMAGGPGNPLGARAMYLGGTVYRIHGTNAPDTIGQQVSSGCIRLINEDVTDLYNRVNVGTKVVVLPMIARNTANRVSALH
jgi:lipoprotein-anchoring transpeptidase ErfK/SrfK